MKNPSVSIFVLTILFLGNSYVFCQFPNVQVSNPAADAPNEVSISVNPAAPNYIAVGSNLNYFYSSSDSGHTWSQKIMSSVFGVWGDPSVLYDANGNLFYGHLSNPPNLVGYWVDRIVIQKSTDNGQGWDEGIGLGYSPPRKQQDKEWLGADFTNSPYKNNIYVAWTEFDSYGSFSSSDSSKILFARSTNSGVSWETPIRISDKAGDCVDDDNTDEGAVPAVGPDGQVYISWSGPGGIFFDKSLDGGKTFGKDVFVTTQPGGWAFNIPGIDRCNGMPITACDVSSSQYRGNIYILWSDQRNGEDNTDVFITKSTDEGETWGNIVRVNDDNSNRQQFFPWMTIDQSTGYIYVVFYDRRETTEDATDVYLARSTDGGETFKNLKISESSFVPDSNYFFGDYIGITALNGNIYPVWMRMDNHVLSIWTALVKESGIATAIKDEKELPSEYKLYQNYPNPFNGSTVISFYLANPSFVTLKIYDILGNEIAAPVNKFMTKGSHEIKYNALGLTSGVYFYRLNAGDFTTARKFILLK